jgi:ATP-binding cassette, subfamily A (ABC1), member 3
MSLPGYWSSNLIFDIFMSYIPIGLIILLMSLFNVNYDGVWVLLLLYPPAIVPFTYVTSFIFRSDINAQITTLFLHFITGGLCVMVIFVLQYIPVTMYVGDPLRWVFCIFPSFCVTHGILFSSSKNLLLSSRVEMETDTGTIIPRKIPEENWAWYNLKGDAAFLIAHFFVGIFLLTLIELEVYKYFSWCPGVGCRQARGRGEGPVLIKDEDVLAEEKRVAQQSINSQQEANGGVDCIRVNNFQKDYDMPCGMPVRAVRKASFGLNYGECFALLGVNGAGKSTTFKSLTREIRPTTGEI